MKKLSFVIVIVALFSSAANLFSQTNFYDINSVREIKIYFDQPNWDYLLDSLYIDGTEGRLVASSMTIDGVQLDSVGVRYKGYSSVSVNRIKNPFNIKINYINSNQNYNGIDKIKLSNVIQDPSFIRETLSYEIARKYMPAGQANFANVYINDTLIGLYTNVEAVNNEFLDAHYNSSENAFFKCNPANLDLFGENSNLSDSPGSDTTLYYPLYDLKSDYGWTDLYELIDTLNNYAGDIEKKLNVDRTLWMHAFNYSLINFDSYVGYAQNYYVYKDNNGRFNPILWDLNQSFASYRLADASIHFSGFSILEAKNMDPLLHYNNVSVYPRPLMRNLFNNDRYRKMYIAHIRTIMQENFANQDYATRAQTMQTLIDSHVQNDTNKFYSYNDFTNNLNSTVTDLVDYPGITDLMDDRTIYLSDYPGMLGAPDITNINSTPSTVSIGDSVWIISKVTDADSVILAYRFSNSELFNKVDMFDDGLHNDGIAGDSIYGFLITNIGQKVEYYIYADNDSSGRFSPERAAYEYYTITTSGDLVINELAASNFSIQMDQDGQYDDWIELYNNTSTPISLDGYHLSDDANNFSKWTFPTGTTINGNDYLIVWADKDTFQLGLHANFKLSATGETLYLTDTAGVLLDETNYGTQTTDITWGRYPNGTGPFVFMNPTYSATNSNSPVGIEEESVLNDEFDFNIFPNPARDKLYIRFKELGEYKLILRDINGRELIIKNIESNTNTHLLNISDFAKGFYILSISNDVYTVTKKVIIK